MIYAQLLVQLDEFRSCNRWPEVSIAFTPDYASEKREAQVAGSLLPIVEYESGESCPVVVQLRSARGLAARMVAKHVWNATVVAVGHWCDASSTAYHEGWRRSPAAVFGLFERDCAECRERVVPMRRTPRGAIGELRKFGLAPNLVITGGDAEEVVADVTAFYEAFPAARFVGTGWRGTVGDAVRRLLCRLELEVHAIGDAWLIWRDDEPWIETGRSSAES